MKARPGRKGRKPSRRSRGAAAPPPRRATALDVRAPRAGEARDWGDTGGHAGASGSVQRVRVRPRATRQPQCLRRLGHPGRHGRTWRLFGTKGSQVRILSPRQGQGVGVAEETPRPLRPLRAFQTDRGHRGTRPEAAAPSGEGVSAAGRARWRLALWAARRLGSRPASPSVGDDSDRGDAKEDG